MRSTRSPWWASPARTARPPPRTRSGTCCATGRRTGGVGHAVGTTTTPEAPALQRALARCRDDGFDAVAMEVSSHALALGRVSGAHFDVGLHQPRALHLDFHGTVERYFAAKAHLFEGQFTDVGVVNTDDVHGRLLFDTASIPLVPFSIDDLVDVVVGPTSHEYTWRGRRVRVGLGGGFNVMNSLAAATACASLGIDEAEVVAALSGAPAVPGRFEPVDAGQPFTVLADYAHTPDGPGRRRCAVRRHRRRRPGDRRPAAAATADRGEASADGIGGRIDSPTWSHHLRQPGLLGGPARDATCRGCPTTTVAEL
ncbi:MAG: Mur ligase family protein [Ilumatobacteraceae bacterium]